MTGKQRFLAAIRSDETDRHSVHPAIDLSYAAARYGFGVGECFMNPSLHAKALSFIFECHPDIDGLYVNLCLCPDACESLWEDGDSFYGADFGGMTWAAPKNDIGSVKTRDIASLSDERLFTQNPLKEGILATYTQIPQNIRDEYMIVPGLTGPFSQIVFMLGLEETLIQMFDDTAGLERALEARTLMALEWAEEYSRLGCECVWIGEGAASSSIISPAMYERFVMPYAQQVVKRLHQRGVRTIMHVCGDINKSAAIIAQTGVDVMDIDYMVPLDHARAATGGKICLKGNFNPMELLAKSAPEIESACAALISGAPRPFVLSTGCLVARDTPPENVEAMVGASKTALQ